MEKETTVLEDQSWLDMAIQTGGSLESVFDLVVAGDVSLTDTPAVGRVITNPDTNNKSVTDYYSAKELTPATGDIAILGGIGYMAVGIDFIVS
jgi:hypothetical protein